MNQVKAVTEFQIFTILLICCVLQTNTATKDQNFDTEVVTVETYGYIQIGLALLMVPVAVYSLYRNFTDFVAEVTDGSRGDADVAPIRMEFDNPVHETPTTTAS